MYKTVETAEIDKDTEIGDVLDRALEHHAHLDIGKHLFAACGVLLFEDDLVADDDILRDGIDLDDPEIHGLADKSIEIANRFDIDLRTGKEDLDTGQGNRHTALDAVDDPLPLMIVSFSIES